MSVDNEQNPRLEYGSLEDLVQQCTHQNGIVVDVFEVAKALRFEIELVEMSNSVDLGFLQANEKGRERKISISNALSLSQQRTIVAYTMAESIVMPELMIAPRKIQFTVFTLRDFRQMRFARVMLLATRFAFSESTIDALAELGNNAIMKECIRWYEPEFANATVRGQSIEFLMDNQIIR